MRVKARGSFCRRLGGGTDPSGGREKITSDGPNRLKASTRR